MTSQQRATIEQQLLMARLQIRRASAEIERSTALEHLVDDVAAAWALLDGVCSRFCSSDSGMLRSRPFDRDIGQVAGAPADFTQPVRSPNRKPRQPRAPRPPRDVQRELRLDRRAGRAKRQSSSDSAGYSPADQ